MRCLWLHGLLYDIEAIGRPGTNGTGEGGAVWTINSVLFPPFSSHQPLHSSLSITHQIHSKRSRQNEELHRNSYPRSRCFGRRIGSIGYIGDLQCSQGRVLPWLGPTRMREQWRPFRTLIRGMLCAASNRPSSRCCASLPPGGNSTGSTQTIAQTLISTVTVPMACASLTKVGMSLAYYSEYLLHSDEQLLINSSLSLHSKTCCIL